MSDTGSEWDPYAQNRYDEPEDSDLEAGEAAQDEGDDDDDDGDDDDAPKLAKKRGRCSVRQRNNKRIQEFKDTPRLKKRIEVRFKASDWVQLRHIFQVVPDSESQDSQTDARRLNFVSLRAEGSPNDQAHKKPPSVMVDGLLIGSRWSAGKRSGGGSPATVGFWQGDVLDISALKLEATSPEMLQLVVDQRMQQRFALQETVVLHIIVQVKLKVELFEVALPSKRSEAPAIHSYTGPLQMKDTLKTIPSYVPPEKFLNLNAGSARCWVAKTMVQRGSVQATHYQVGPDHCFQPGEIITFRIHAEKWRFRTPVWVVSATERDAFQRLLDEGKCKEGFLVKETLKAGDRFVLMPCFDRAATGRYDWRSIREKEPVEDLMETKLASTSTGTQPQRTADCGYLTRSLVTSFALDKPDKDGRPKEVKVLHVDCHCLTTRLSVPAFIGAPLREKDDVSAPSPPGLAVQAVNHYMDLRGRLGFNAMGLLHRREEAGITDEGVAIEVPLSNNSVMLPRSQLLFLDYWRDTQEQKAFRKVLEKIQEKDFLQEMPRDMSAC